MKKTLLATALAVGFAGAASAQTSVTLFGIVDAGFGYVQYKDKNRQNTDTIANGGNGYSSKATRTGGFQGNHNGNRWGLRGSEDLGGGLSAIFWLENGFTIFDGKHGQGGRLFGRQAWMGLKGDSWGQITLGRQYSPTYDYAAGVVGVTADGFGESNVGTSFSALNGTRADNMIRYETPSFGGFKLGLAYSFQYNGDQPFDVSGTQDKDQTFFSGAVNYTNGPLEIAAAYDQLNKRDNVVGEKDVKSWLIGASYDFEVVKLHLGFGQDKNGTITEVSVPYLVRGALSGTTLTSSADPKDPGSNYAGTSGYEDGYKTNNYAVGLAVPLEGAGLLRFGWHSSRLSSGKYRNDVTAGGGKRSQNLYSIVYKYDLSKRTAVYAFGVHGTGYAFNDMTVNQAVVGLKHSF